MTRCRISLISRFHFGCQTGFNEELCPTGEVLAGWGGGGGEGGERGARSQEMGCGVVWSYTVLH